MEAAGVRGLEGSRRAPREHSIYQRLGREARREIHRADASRDTSFLQGNVPFDFDGQSLWQDFLTGDLWKKLIHGRNNDSGKHQKILFLEFPSCRNHATGGDGKPTFP